MVQGQETASVHIKLIQSHKPAGSKAVQKVVPQVNPSQMVNVSLESAAATGR